jgi:hypothetical protein
MKWTSSLKSSCEGWGLGMAKITFEDYTVKVLEAMDSKINIALEEVAGEVEGQVKDLTRTDTSQTKNNWKHHVDEIKHEATIGNSLENAIWEEFGTGEYALQGKGRKGGYWVYVKGESGKSSHTGKTYTLQEAKRVMAILRSKGLDAYYTKGKKPSRAFWKTYTLMKDWIKKHLQGRINEL